MLLPSEVSVLWLIAVILLSAIAIGIIYSTEKKATKSVVDEKEEKITSLETELEEKTKQHSELLEKIESIERKIQLQKDLKIRQVRHSGEPQIRIYQGFANASDFNVKITKIESILRDENDEIIDQYTYNQSNLIFKDEHKLFFPKDTEPLCLNNEIEYRIIGAERLAKTKTPVYFKQVIKFSTKATAIIKTADKTLSIQPKDWKGGGL